MDIKDATVAAIVARAIAPELEGLTDVNDHTGAALLIAQNFGTPAQIARVQEIERTASHRGYTHAADIATRRGILDDIAARLERNGWQEAQEIIWGAL